VLIYDSERMTLPVSESSPIDPYKNRYVLSKYLLEEASKFYQRWMPIITCRFCNLYGPTPLRRFDLIHVVIRQILEKGSAEVWTEVPSRDFIYCEDAAHAIVKLLYTDYAGMLVLGTGTMTSVARVLEILREITGCAIEVLNQPVQGPVKFRADPTLLKSLIGWEPRFSIEEGIKQTYKSMKAWHQS
jgi:UDP-glucose 4-epimerase